MYQLRRFNRRKLIAVAFSIAITSIVSAGPGNYNQQGAKLVGSGYVGFPQQGEALSLSADGNTLLIGGPNDNNALGAAWVFTRSNGIWTQQGGKLVGTGAVGQSGQGASVALSADGNTAAVGGPEDAGTGAVWVFVRSNGVWTQQGPKLIGTGGDNTSSQFFQQGFSLALSADGGTLVEGAPQDANALGAVWVFARSGGVWTQQGAKLVGTGAVPPTTVLHGQAVAISADGNTMAERNEGFAQGWVFTRSGGVWTQQGGRLVGSNSAGRADFVSLSLTSDGNTILLGNTFFYRKHGVWSQNGTVSPTSSFFDEYALSSDGSTAVAGALTAEVYLFGATGGVWSQRHLYKASGFQTQQAGGTLNTVALSANGNTMVLGNGEDTACSGCPGIGATWVFATPQLSTSLKHTGNFHRGQTGATYSITVSNVGDRDIHALVESAVNIIDNLPSDLIATDIAGNGWSCTLATVSCTRQDGLAVGASFPPVTVTVNVAANAPASVANAATASGGGSTWGNARDVTTIVP